MYPHREETDGADPRPCGDMCHMSNPVGGAHLPSRRTVLLGGMGAAALGALGACREKAAPDARPPRKPARLTFAPLASSSALMSPHAVRSGTFGITAGTRHAAALAVVTHRDYVSSVLTVTAGAPEGTPVPVDPRTSRVAFDPTPDLVMVIAARVEGSGLVHDLLTSSDLVSWTTSPLGEAVSTEVQEFAGGLALVNGAQDTIDVVEIAADATVAARGTLPIPEGQRWVARGLARRDDQVLVACTAPGREPFTVASRDAGATWSEPVELPPVGRGTVPRSLVVHGDTFVILGSTKVDPDAVEGAVAYTHLVAWSTGDLTTFTPETVPLPTDSWEGYVRDDGSELDPGPFELADKDYAMGSPGLAADGAGLDLPRYWLDSADVVTRAPDGSWHLSDRSVVHSQFIRDVVEGPGGFVLATDDGVVVHRSAGGGTVDGLRTSPRRDSTGTGPFGVTAGGGTTRWRVTSIVRDGPAVGWESRTDREYFTVQDEQLVARTDLPVGKDAVWTSLLAVADDGREAVVVEPRAQAQDVAYQGARGWSREGEIWSEMTGLPAEGCFDPGSFRWTGTQYVLVGSISSDRERPRDSPWVGRVWTSPDAISWSEITGLPERSHVADVVQLGEVLTAGGITTDEDGSTQATIFRHGADGWAVTSLGEVGGTSRIDTIGVIAGEIVAFGEIDDRNAAWSVPVEDAPDIIYRADGTGSRGTVTDLGSACLLAPGWCDDPEVGRGGVVWASADGGDTWDATLIPGDDGRGDSIDLERDGDDVIVLVSTPDGPRAYRIRSAVQNIQGTSAPAAGSDGGGG